MTVAKTRALALRRKHHLPGPPSDEALVGICREEGLTVELDCPELVGRVREVLIGDCLCLARDLEQKERRWLIAHGLGHWLLHEPGGYFSLGDRRIGRGQQEWQAEAFAGWFLCSKDGRVPSLVLSEGVDALSGWAGVPYLSAEKWLRESAKRSESARWALA